VNGRWETRFQLNGFPRRWRPTGHSGRRWGISAGAPALAAARAALEPGEVHTAPSTVVRFLGQYPRNSEAADLRRTVLLQQGRTLLAQNMSWTATARPTSEPQRLGGHILVEPKYAAAWRSNTIIRACSFSATKKLPAAIAEWRTVLQYEPSHDGAKRNIAQAERLVKGLQERRRKQGR